MITIRGRGASMFEIKNQSCHGIGAIVIIIYQGRKGFVFIVTVPNSPVFLPPGVCFIELSYNIMCAAQITIMYSNPVLVALLAWALRGEVLSLRGCAGIAVTLLGVVVVAQPPFLFGGHEWSPTRLAGRLLGSTCLAPPRAHLVAMCTIGGRVLLNHGNMGQCMLIGY